MTDETAPKAADASDGAQAIAALVVDKKAMPAAAAEDLARLLAHGLAVPHHAVRRQSQLGLLITLVSEGSGEFIDTAAYEAARAERGQAGETWPTASALSRGFGHWLAAVRAACRYWFDGGRARVVADHRHLTERLVRYEPREIINGILQAQAELKLPQDKWPTEWEYYEWARIRRQLARRSGNACRLPERKAIQTGFGGYDQAVKAAARIADSNGRGPVR